MPIPKLDFTDEVATVTMMELRQQPGEIMDRVARGLTVYVTKSGRAVAKTELPDGEEPGHPRNCSKCPAHMPTI